MNMPHLSTHAVRTALLVAALGSGTAFAHGVWATQRAGEVAPVLGEGALDESYMRRGRYTRRELSPPRAGRQASSCSRAAATSSSPTPMPPLCPWRSNTASGRKGRTESGWAARASKCPRRARRATTSSSARRCSIRWPCHSSPSAWTWRSCRWPIRWRYAAADSVCTGQGMSRRLKVRCSVPSGIAGTAPGTRRVLPRGACPSSRTLSRQAG